MEDIPPSGIVLITSHADSDQSAPHEADAVQGTGTAYLDRHTGASCAGPGSGAWGERGMEGGETTGRQGGQMGKGHPDRGEMEKRHRERRCGRACRRADARRKAEAGPMHHPRHVAPEVGSPPNESPGICSRAVGGRRARGPKGDQRAFGGAVGHRRPGGRKELRRCGRIQSEAAGVQLRPWTLPPSPPPPSGQQHSHRPSRPARSLRPPMTASSGTTMAEFSTPLPRRRA